MSRSTLRDRVRQILWFAALYCGSVLGVVAAGALLRTAMNAVYGM